MLAVQVVQVKTQEKEGYNALQLGCGSKRDKQLNGRQLGHFKAADIGNKRKVRCTCYLPWSCSGVVNSLLLGNSMQ